MNTTNKRRAGLAAIAALLAACCVLSWASGANASLFIKFHNINGESVEEHHRDWSDISSVSWGVSLVPTTGGALIPDFDDLAWDQDMDRSVPLLFQAITMLTVLDDATVDFTFNIGSGELTYFQMYFEDVRLTGLHIAGDSSSMAQVHGSFSYGSITMTYTQYGPDGSPLGSTEASYDLGLHSDSLADLVAVYAQGITGPTIVPIPVPAAVWLLGSGLTGLFALIKKIKH